MLNFIEDKINHYANVILTGGDKRDSHALGELAFYMVIRRVLKGEQTVQDVGMVDAINDVLQEGGVIDEGKTFIERLK
jgi:hypothetical protein|tara:strand:+ start:148 stop:381 length:234 start_codon:yes stop_codon:yes gene_type:complete